MRYENIRTLEKAFQYFTDVAIANLDYFYLRQSASKYERKRHILICEKMFVIGKEFGIDLSMEKERFNDIIKGDLK